MVSANVGHYLKAIYKGGEDQVVSLPALAKKLKISITSVNEMVKKLVNRELITYEPYKGVVLTPEGRDQAAIVTRSHRLWERFLTDILGLGWDQVHEEACRLEHATSSLVEERLAQLLGWPEICPHGYPVPTPEGEIAHEVAFPLSDLKPGQKAVVLYVPEVPEILRYLGELGIMPQTEVEIESVAPFEGVLSVRVGDTQYVMGQQVALQIMVRIL
jgi:DtxR family Mn-dependent transcriptional regulator